MKRLLFLSALALLATTANAAPKTLRCEVKDFGNLLSGHEPTSIATLAIEPEGYGAIRREELKDGHFGCRVVYNLQGPRNVLSIHLYRSDAISSRNDDRAFSADKAVDTMVQQFDLSDANERRHAAFRGQVFGAGMCHCQTAN